MEPRKRARILLETPQFGLAKSMLRADDPKTRRRAPLAVGPSSMAQLQALCAATCGWHSRAIA
jgi:hypothetical protein